MSTDVPWLSAGEEHLWRGWLKLNAELSAALQRELQRDAGLSMPDFDVLVHLTDTTEGRVRVSDLAGLLQWERSRVSHHVKRMEGRGLVLRTECLEDGRGALVDITSSGRAAIENAAPGHVRAVRRLFFNALGPADVGQLASLIDKILSRGQEIPAANREPEPEPRVRAAE